MSISFVRPKINQTNGALLVCNPDGTPIGTGGGGSATTTIIYGTAQTLQSGAQANGNGSEASTNNAHSIIFTVSGLGSAVINPEYSLNGTNWYPLTVKRAGSTTTSNTISSNGLYAADVIGLSSSASIRARISDYQSGTINVTATTASAPVSVIAGAEPQQPLIKTAYASITTGSTTSSPIDKRGYGLGTIIIPSNLTGTNITITFTVSDTEDGTYMQLRDIAGNQVSLTSVNASGARPLPYELAGAHYFRIVTSTTQTTDNKTFTVTLGA